MKLGKLSLFVSVVIVLGLASFIFIKNQSAPLDKHASSPDVRESSDVADRAEVDDADHINAEHDTDADAPTEAVAASPDIATQSDDVVPDKEPEQAVDLTEVEKAPVPPGMLTNDPEEHSVRRGRNRANIVLANAIINPALSQAGQGIDVPVEWQASPDSQARIIQFDRPVSSRDVAALTKVGVQVSHYVPFNAYLIHGDEEALNSVSQLEGFKHQEFFHPYYKLARPLAEYFTSDQPSELSRVNSELGSYRVLLRPGEDPRLLLEKFGLDESSIQQVGEKTIAAVDTSVDRVRELAALDGVIWLEPNTKLELMNDLGRETMQVSRFNLLHPDLNGSGVVVNVNDTGIDFNHLGFSVDPSLATSTGLNSRIIYYEAQPSVTSDGIPGDADSHGTHVAGTILGNGALSDTAISVPGSGSSPYETNQFRGVAPEAQIVVLEDFNSFTDEEMAETAYSQGARLSNNSWGNTLFQYGLGALAWDGLVRDADGTTPGNQQLIAFFAAGNSGGGNNTGTGGTAGTVGNPGNAKNVISVGAVEQNRQANNIPGLLAENDSSDQVAPFSSRGPVDTTDQRVKPDIVAPGTYVLSAQTKDVDLDTFSDPAELQRDIVGGNVNTVTNYAFLSGTSMASPMATGVGALFYQYYLKTFGVAPSPALTKSALVAGARNLNSVLYKFSPLGNEPSIVHQGWGSVDVVQTVDGPRIQPTDQLTFLDQQDITPVETGETYTFPISVSAGQGGIKIVLAWTDPAESPANGIALVNDLDLILRANDGSGFIGNYFEIDGLHSRKQSTVDVNFGDHLNNVELIVVPDLAPGNYTVEVFGFGVPSGPQDFALTISQGVGLQGETEGEKPDLALDVNERPVVAYSTVDSGGFTQIFVKRWLGSLSIGSGTGDWVEVDGQWFGVSGSTSGTGISQTLGDSLDPVLAIDSNNYFFVAWEQVSTATNFPTSIFLRQHVPSLGWVELGGSASFDGLSDNVGVEAHNPDIAMTTNQHPVVVWQEGNGSTSQIKVAVWNTTNWVGLAGSKTLGLPGVIQGREPSIAVDGQNRIVVAYEERDNNRIRVLRWSGASWITLGSRGGDIGTRKPDVAVGPGDEVYVAWQQLPNAIAGHFFTQAYVERYNGGWAGLAGSATYPGISGSTSGGTTPEHPQVFVSPNGEIFASFQEDDQSPNAMIVKQFTGAAWVGVAGAGVDPGVADLGGLSRLPELVVDSQDIPFLGFQNDASGIEEVLVYSLSVDRDAPDFLGVATAVGGTNQNVFLSWNPADDVSQPITYLIYQGLTNFPCGSTPNCSASDVFTNQIGSTTSLTFEVTGLTDAMVYCFGVRAQDAEGLIDDNVKVLSAGPISGAGDPDSDCLENMEEQAAGTDVCIPDTDGDMMEDGWEWTFSTNNVAHTNALAMNPLDNGTDNLATVAVDDGVAAQGKDQDLDGDGASNFEEYEWWVMNTTNGCLLIQSSSPDPTDPDTDDDGIPDGFEIINGLNPIVDDSGDDTDGDGLINLDEFNNGSDPNNPDSDGDGIIDGTEVTNGTNPIDPDSDGDGLTDDFEPAIGSDPLDSDSNDSGVNDGDTFQLGYDDPSAAITNFICFLSEDFETSSRTNWTHQSINPFLPFDLWHLTTTEPESNRSSFVAESFHTTTTAYRVANDPTGTDLNATYNIGSLLSMALFSPEVDVSAVGLSGSLFVEWKEFYETEPNQDLVQVQARGGGNTNWFIVSPPESGRSGASGPNDPTLWVQRRADLSAFIGSSNLQVRFVFNALNSINNEFRGWWVDDVRICEGVAVTGFVRDKNGRPVEGAIVRVIGRGGVTNIVNGHRIVPPGKIFEEALTGEDGYYELFNLPAGEFRAKVSHPSYIDEFWNGILFFPGYGFDTGINPGVDAVEKIGLAGIIGLLTPGVSQDANFEIEIGSGRSCLGVSSAGAGGGSLPVTVNGNPIEVWNGSTSTPAFVAYETAAAPGLTNNLPDYLDNPVQPELYCELVPGEYLIGVGTNLNLISPATVPIREGETTLVDLSTNQASSRAFVTAADGGNYDIILNGQDSGFETPHLFTNINAGAHQVSLSATNLPFVGSIFFDAPLAGRTNIVFGTNALSGTTGAISLSAQDERGNIITGAIIRVNGELVGIDDVPIGFTNVTPTVVNNLLPGTFSFTLEAEGYRNTQNQLLTIQPGVTNSFVFILGEADADYDRVGDFVEITGYTNIFLFHRNDDPDGDGLNNEFEFTQFRRFNVFMNPFNEDTDQDRMLDGDELAYDGVSNRLAISILRTNAVDQADRVEALFVGCYLDGIDNFGSGTVRPAIECDKFEGVISHPLVPTLLGQLLKDPALTVYTNIPSFPESLAITVGHNDAAEILADGMPDRVDTDGDGMWDGYEFAFGLGTIAQLDVIECGRENEDPDFDGLSNFEEFLGPDFTANTNDWSNPTTSDSDGDGLPDGWEYFYGFNPNSGADAFSDTDGDGLLAISEFLAGSNPTLADTDGDFLPDGDEVVIYGTDPNDIDTDDDGLLDGREVYDRDLDGIQDGGFFPGWNGGDMDNDGFVDGPTDWDTDGDGMPDGFEVIDAFGNIRNPALNPADPTDADVDQDGDGLTALQEYLVRDSLFGNDPASFGLGGVVWDYSSDPFNFDSDGDGLPDGFEAINGLHPRDPVPVNGGGEETRHEDLGPEGDIDGDGLWNDREYRVRFHLDPNADPAAVDSLSTHPWNDDTDGDGLEDGEEDRAFRSNPIVQDTDQDRLFDGAGIVNRFGETESIIRTGQDYLLVSCTNCSWDDAKFMAETTPHPIFTNLFGHLVAINDPLEDVLVASLLTGVETNVAIGGFDVFVFTNGLNEVTTNFLWVTLEDTELYRNFAPGEPSGPQLGVLSMNAGGMWETKASSTLEFDHYVVEWDHLPVITNHFDQALNDLWKLRWPRDDNRDWPFWERVVLDTNSILPAARWGASMGYIPVFETKLPRDESESDSVKLMDNRKLALFGGRDGVTRHSDVWEYIVSSNVWSISRAPMTPDGLYLDGMSEMDTVTRFGYRDTKDCDFCNENPCDGENFLLPKTRPFSGPTQTPMTERSESFDLTYIFGGWDQEQRYFSSGFTDFAYYKSSDDLSMVIEELTADEDVYEVDRVTVNTSSGSTTYDGPFVLSRDASLEDIKIGGVGVPVMSVEGDDVHTDTWVMGALHFGGTVFTDCEVIQFAELVYDIVETNLMDITIDLTLEVQKSTDSSPEGYNPATENDYTPRDRLGTTEFYNTTNATFVIPAGTFGLITNNITALVQELITSGEFGASSFGVLIESTNSNSTIAGNGTFFIRVGYSPSYKVEPFWENPTSITISHRGGGLPNRKMSGLAYDYAEDKMVMFGGINGNVVLGDTWTGIQNFNGSYELRNLFWEEQGIDPSPPARYGHAMAYDAKNQRTVIFGGFNKDHEPLNDMWVTVAFSNQSGTVVTTNVFGDVITNSSGFVWQEITSYQDVEVPTPRGGASMVFFGGFDYNRGITDYCEGSNGDMLVLFGGTDGKHYYNDLWVFDDNDNRWVMVNASGENSKGPSPRAFASMAYAQNANGVFDRSENPPCAGSASFLFGGRKGLVLTGTDTDRDFVDDGVEYELGGPEAGRDPRVNRLVELDQIDETVPYAIKQFGSQAAIRGYVADFESMKNTDAKIATIIGAPFERIFDPQNSISISVGDFDEIGVESERPDIPGLWYTRFGGEDPFNPLNEWEVGQTSDAAGGPRYAIGGRWAWGTDLDSNYANDSIMELYSPLFDLIVPSTNSFYTNFVNNFFLLYDEWLDLADSNDVVRVELVRPETPADIANRKTGLTRPVKPVLGNRHSAFNTTGDWRRVVLPLDVAANETNLFLRFTLQSDAVGAAAGWYIDNVAILQAGEIMGTFTNLPNTDVALLGTNFNNHIYDVTTADGTGFFQFGLLPLGDYMIGSPGGQSIPVSVTPADPSADIGMTNNVPFSITSVVNPFLPALTVSFDSIPGGVYRIEYTDDLLLGPWLTLQDNVPSGGATTSIIDPSPQPYRYYRVIFKTFTN